jgi:hypothetical protein
MSVEKVEIQFDWFDEFMANLDTPGQLGDRLIMMRRVQKSGETLRQYWVEKVKLLLKINGASMEYKLANLFSGVNQILFDKAFDGFINNTPKNPEELLARLKEVDECDQNLAILPGPSSLPDIPQMSVAECEQGSKEQSKDPCIGENLPQGALKRKWGAKSRSFCRICKGTDHDMRECSVEIETEME